MTVLRISSFSVLAVSLLLSACFACSFASGQETKKVPLIFDTGMAGDYDDVGALTALHALADSGEVRILATVSCNKYKLTAISIDAINHYYGRSDLPIGSPRIGKYDGGTWRFTDALAADFPHRLNVTDEVPDAVQIYRRILAGEPDASVVVVTVGFFTNLSALLQSPPDQYSPLDGKQLVAKKVKHLVAMAGRFPEGKEWNVYGDAQASKLVFEQWPTRIILSGWEIGANIFTGKRLVASGIKNTPAKAVFTMCLRLDNQPEGHESYDQTAVLVAVRGADRYFNTVKGQIKLEQDGSNSWQDDPNGKHEYLTWKMPIDELTKVIEDLMMHEPVNRQQTKRIPLIYSSDLYHPHGDPDDHYDLAMLNAMKAFDVKAHIFDLSIPGRNPEEYGLAPLRQIAAIANKPLPPYAIGLRDALTSPDDKGENRPKEHQKGVELLLKTLRESDEKVTLFMVGSCRDFAAAYNREPELLKQKVAAVYVNAGNGPDGIQVEWNVFADQQAYVCLMNSGLPIYWSPCFSKEERTATPQEVAEKRTQAFNTYFIVPNQAELLKNTSDEVKNYFSYALSKSQEEPLSYLKQSPKNLPKMPRSMWGTAPFLHAAGWKIYAHNDRYIACPPEKAKTLGIADKEAAVYEYKNVLLTSLPAERATSEQFGFAKGRNNPVLKGVLTDSDSPVKVFRYIHPEYNTIMVSVLSELLNEL